MKQTRLFNSKGQAITEAVLYMVVIVAVLMLVSKAFKNNELLVSVVQAPWTNLSGMIQNGSWGTPEDTNYMHPNNSEHQRTKDPL